MKQSLIIIYLAAAILLIIGFLIGGSQMVVAGLNISINTHIGLFNALGIFCSHRPLNVLLTADIIEKWLQKFSGIKAIVVSALAGGLFPGGPYIYYPFVASFKEKKLPFYILTSFLFGKYIYDFSRIPLEASLVSPNIAFIRYLITFPIPIIVGLIVLRFFKDTPSYDYNLKAGEKDGSNNYNS